MHKFHLQKVNFKNKKSVKTETDFFDEKGMLGEWWNIVKIDFVLKGRKESFSLTTKANCDII